MHSADCGTDHALVCCKLQITLRKFHQTRPKPLPFVNVSSTRNSLRNQRFQPDWFRDNIDLLLPAVAAKRSARLKVTVRNSCSAHRELQAAKRTVQCLTRFAVSRYWENHTHTAMRRLRDLRGLCSGIREAQFRRKCPLYLQLTEHSWLTPLRNWNVG